MKVCSNWRHIITLMKSRHCFRKWFGSKLLPELMLKRIYVSMLLLGVSRPQWVNLYILITFSLFVEPDEFSGICVHCVHWQIIFWSSFGACTSAKGPNHFRFITRQLLSKRYNIRNICVMSGSLILCKPRLFSIQVYVSYVTQNEYHDDLWDMWPFIGCQEIQNCCHHLLTI